MDEKTSEKLEMVEFLSSMLKLTWVILQNTVSHQTILRSSSWEDSFSRASEVKLSYVHSDNWKTVEFPLGPSSNKRFHMLEVPFFHVSPSLSNSIISIARAVTMYVTEIISFQLLLFLMEVKADYQKNTAMHHNTKVKYIWSSHSYFFMQLFTHFLYMLCHILSMLRHHSDYSHYILLIHSELFPLLS